MDRVTLGVQARPRFMICRSQGLRGGVDRRRSAKRVPQKMPSTVAYCCSPETIGPLGVVVAEQDPQHIDAVEQVERGCTGRVRAQVGAAKRNYQMRLPGPGLTQLVH